MPNSNCNFKKLFTAGIISVALTLVTASMAFSGNALSTQSSSNIPFLPDVKLLIGEGPIYTIDFDNYNSDTGNSGYSITENFLDLASMDGHEVVQAAYSSATTGTNLFIALNTLGYETVSNKVKYSTYRINRLPKIGLTAGNSYDLVLAPYVFDTSYINAIPPSFGGASSVTLSNSSTLAAEWVNDSILRISAASTFNEASYVDIIASPSANPPFGDFDRERLYVYPNLLPIGTFLSESAVERFTYEPVADRATTAGHHFFSWYLDLAGENADGLLWITLDNESSGVKITPNGEDLIPYEAGQWYIARMKVMSDRVNNEAQVLLYNYSNPAFPGNHVDIAANAWFGVPTTWSWLETPLYSNRTGMGYPQIQVKESVITPANNGPKIKAVTDVYIDELQLIKAVPSLVDSRKGKNRMHYYAGNFDDITDINGWGIESYTYDGNTTGLPSASISDGVLHLTFDTTSTAINGAKLTAYNEGASSVKTFQASLKQNIGAQARIVNLNGNFDSYESIALIVGMGVQQLNSYDIGTRGSDLFAAAEFGGLTPGVHQALGSAISYYYQYQFAVKTDQPGIIDFDDFDMLANNNEEYYGDGELFN